MKIKKALENPRPFTKKPLAVTRSAYGSIYCFRSWAQQADHTKKAKKIEEFFYLVANHVHNISLSSHVFRAW